MLKVADEGGGIPRSIMSRLFGYTFSTFNHRPTDYQQAPTSPRPGDSDLNPLQRESASGGRVPTVAGYGVGLTLARLYAWYFGGDLALKSLEGIGTDAYLHINRLGTNCEELPEVVRASPSMRDSNFSDLDGIRFLRQDITPDEEIALRAYLMELRNKKE